MKNMDRRSFIRQAAAAAGALALPWSAVGESLLAAPARSFAADDRVTLGSTGLVTSRMALGSGTRGYDKSSEQTRMGLENFLKIIRHSYDQGITFWDTADFYGSHGSFREALKQIPREKLVILTKSFSRDAEGMKKDIERFRMELGVDTIDILLLHCLTDPGWTGKMQPTMEVISQAREKGAVRTFGVSCHDLGALQAAAASPWPEVILARINHAGVAMDAAVEKVVPVLRQARENGKSVLGMKIVGEGRLRDQIDQSLKFVLSLGIVDAFTVGFQSVEELDQMIEKIAAVRL